MFESYHESNDLSMRLCPSCNSQKPTDAFVPHYNNCRECINKKRLAEYHKNKVVKPPYKKPLPTYLTDGHRICTKCLVDKPLDDFSKVGDRFNARCMVCVRAIDHERSLKDRKKIPVPSAVNGGKVCTKCLEEKAFGDFMSTTRGLNPQCKICVNNRNRTRYQEIDKTTILEKNQRWYEENKEKHHDLCQKWNKTNRNKVVGYAQKRRAVKLNAIIDDTIDYKRIDEKSNGVCYICETAILSTHKTEYDHYIPLNPRPFRKTQGGPHSEENLFLVHECCNQRKGDGPFEKMRPYQRRGPD